MDKEKELLREYKTKKKEYLKSSRKIGTYYYSGVKKLLKKGNKEEATKFLKNCPCQIMFVGLTNMINNQE